MIQRSRQEKFEGVLGRESNLRIVGEPLEATRNTGNGQKTLLVPSGQTDL